MPISAVLLDIDGVLTEGKGKQIHTKPFTLIQNSAQSEVPLAVCTGRPQPYAEPILQLLGHRGKIIPSIVENGCFLWDPKTEKLILDPLLSEQLVSLRAMRVKIQEHIRHVSMEPGKELCISLNPPSGVSIEDLFRQTQDALDEFLDLIELTHSNSAVDITPRGINKASGAKHLCTIMGYRLNDLLSIGDSNNDIAVLEVVGHIGCPDNATNAVKDLVRTKGGYIARQSYGMGCVEILQHYDVF